MRSASAGHRRPRERQCCRQRGRFFCLAFRASANGTPMNDVSRQAGRIQGFPAAPELVLPPQTLVISLRRAALQGAPQLSFLIRGIPPVLARQMPARAYLVATACSNGASEDTMRLHTW